MMRSSAASNTAPAASIHLIGWLVAACISVGSGWGLTVADTKHDLVAAPGHFLAGALHAYSETFPFGQIQNQAYGYLFPQGFFFLLADPLPDWVAQRLWWTLTLGLGFSGMLLLADTLLPRRRGAVVAAAVYTLAPHTLATLTAISSETWPGMLTPWLLWCLLKGKQRGALWCVFAMGAVNATATLAAVAPALLLTRSPKFWVRVGLVCSWWIVPLLVLGRYSPPFTEFIESAYVTTHWLQPLNVLRGATSWVPFLSQERYAGFLLSTQPVFVVVTGLVAAVGLYGAAQLPRRLRWMLLLGMAIMCLPPDSLLDGPLVALRNLHKWDLWVRLPLSLGVGYVAQQRLLFLTPLLLAATAPAWTGNLLPLGAYKQVPAEVAEVAAVLNERPNPARALILPASPFAHQDWGWTRDEPLQPLLHTPWATRDAIPLVDPDTIRGLDGLQAVLLDPSIPATDAFAAAGFFGIDRLVIRHDIAAVRPQAQQLVARAMQVVPLPHITTLGETTIVDISPAQPVDSLPVSVLGGGEASPLLHALFPGERPVFVLGQGAEIVTDTPALVARRYGAGSDSTTATTSFLVDEDQQPSDSQPTWRAQQPSDGQPLWTANPPSHGQPLWTANPPSDGQPTWRAQQPSDSQPTWTANPPSDGQPTWRAQQPSRQGKAAGVHNRLVDYPTDAPRTVLRYLGGSVEVSSLNVDPERAPQMAVDNDPATAWWPETGRGGWLELQTVSMLPRLQLVTTGSAGQVAIINGGSRQDIDTQPGVPRTIDVAGGPTSAVRILVPPGMGIASAQLEHAEITPIIEVPAATADTQAIVLNRLMVPARNLQRRITVADNATWLLRAPSPVRIDATTYQPGSLIQLSAGTHDVDTRASWMVLQRPGFTPGATPGPTIWRRSLTDNACLPPHTRIEAGLVSFAGPATCSGDRPYRLGLFGGAAIALLVLLLPMRAGRPPRAWSITAPNPLRWAALALAAATAFGASTVAASPLAVFALLAVLPIATTSWLPRWLRRPSSPQPATRDQ